MRTRYIIEYKLGTWTSKPLYHIYKKGLFSKTFLDCKSTHREAEDYVKGLCVKYTFRYDKEGKYLGS